MPLIAISIIEYFELKFYIYETFLNYYHLTTNFFVLSTILIVLLYQNIGAFTGIYIILNILMILYYWLPEKYKHIKDIIISSFEVFIISFIIFTTIPNRITDIFLLSIFILVIVIKIIENYIKYEKYSS